MAKNTDILKYLQSEYGETAESEHPTTVNFKPRSKEEILQDVAKGPRFDQVQELLDRNSKLLWANDYRQEIKIYRLISDKTFPLLLKAYAYFLYQEASDNISGSANGNPLPIELDEMTMETALQRVDAFVKSVSEKNESLWPHLADWYWANAVAWALEDMQEAVGPERLDTMSNEEWLDMLDRYLFRDPQHKSRYLMNIYAEDMAQLVLEALDLKNKDMDYLKAFLGLTQQNQVLIPEPVPLPKDAPGYLSTIGMNLYQQLREAIAAQEFKNKPEERWPTASLDSRKGTVKGYAQLRPDPTDVEPILSSEEIEEWRIRMQKAAMEMDDETVDIMDAICHIWLSEVHHDDAMISVTADHFLKFRGLKEQKGGTGRRGGYKDEWRQRVAGHISILKNTWIFAEQDVYKDVEGKGGKTSRQRVREAAAGSAIVVSSVHGQLRIDGSIDPYTWRIRPGDAFSRYLFGPGRQTALLSQKALEFDPYRQAFEKRATRYFSWQWRTRQSEGLYMEPLRVSTIMESMRMKLNEARPGKTIERFEKMMDTLHQHGVIGGWQYTGTYEKWKDWLALKVVIEPPQQVLDQYLKINEIEAEKPKKALPQALTFSPEELKSERLARKLTQMQAAEQIGIDQTTLSKLERAKTIVNLHPDTLQKVMKWLRV